MTVVLSQRKASRSRAEWYGLARPLRDSGLSGTDIARRLGVSHSFVYALLNDPDGSKDRERKRRYAPTCIDCGSEMHGGRGANVGKRCAQCSHKWQAKAYRIWTRETIIAAIKRFAKSHGRPPVASDWNHAGREDGCPPTTAVYQNSANPNAPFRYWADAIEAAGFPRPEVGRYDRNKVTV